MRMLMLLDVTVRMDYFRVTPLSIFVSDNNDALALVVVVEYQLQFLINCCWWWWCLIVTISKLRRTCCSHSIDILEYLVPIYF
mmetsp:Transcript_58943/g.63625  ORF Transcript_58943/g.63625 Transcript_58943/m.63625 type:complete len:83 (-) Transcript_58943:761-1009(-)